MSCSLEDRFATLERDGNVGRSRGSRWEPSSEAEIAPRVRGRMQVGRMLGFFESFPFFQIGGRPWAFVGPVALTCVCIFQGDLSTAIMVSLIVVPDTNLQKRQLPYQVDNYNDISAGHFYSELSRDSSNTSRDVTDMSLHEHLILLFTCRSQLISSSLEMTFHVWRQESNCCYVH